MQNKKVVKRVDLNILDVYLEGSVGKWIKRISCERTDESMLDLRSDVRNEK